MSASIGASKLTGRKARGYTIQYLAQHGGGLQRRTERVFRLVERYGRASITRLKGVSAARRTEPNPVTTDAP